MKPAYSQSIFDLTHSSSVMLHAGMQENGLQAKCTITLISVLLLRMLHYQTWSDLLKNNKRNQWIFWINSNIFVIPQHFIDYFISDSFYASYCTNIIWSNNDYSYKSSEGVAHQELQFFFCFSVLSSFLCRLIKQVMQPKDKSKILSLVFNLGAVTSLPQFSNPGQKRNDLYAFVFALIFLPVKFVLCWVWTHIYSSRLCLPILCPSNKNL